MSQPLLNNVIDDGDRGEAEQCSASTSTMTAPAAATKPATVWRPVIIRVVLGGLALLGLAGVGAASMLAGLDGARANPPSPSALHSSSIGPAVASAAGSALPPSWHLLRRKCRIEFADNDTRRGARRVHGGSHARWQSDSQSRNAGGSTDIAEYWPKARTGNPNFTRKAQEVSPDTGAPTRSRNRGQDIAEVGAENFSRCACGCMRSRDT